MRTEYVECKYRYQAEKECPWASKIAKVATATCALNPGTITMFGKIRNNE